MSRGACWLVACLVLLPLAFLQAFRLHDPVPLPVLHTLGGDFTLDSTLGKPLSLSDLRGDVILLNFGYTGCPDVCPTALARMRDSLALLAPARQRVRPVFVTLDPEFDTVDRIGPYVRFFDPRFIGLTGSETAVSAAASHYKVYFEREPSASETGYAISHSSHIYLLDTNGRVRATFGEGVPVENIATAVRRLLAEPRLLARSLDEG